MTTVVPPASTLRGTRLRLVRPISACPARTPDGPRPRRHHAQRATIRKQERSRRRFIAAHLVTPQAVASLRLGPRSGPSSSCSRHVLSDKRIDKPDDEQRGHSPWPPAPITALPEGRFFAHRPLPFPAPSAPCPMINGPGRSQQNRTKSRINRLDGRLRITPQSSSLHAHVVRSSDQDSSSTRRLPTAMIAPIMT